MAAPAEVGLPEVIDLSQLGPTDLDALLAEEIDVWRERFSWDFRPSADLLRRFLQVHSLFGFALRSGGQIVGYSYYVCEGRKGLIGDFFVRAGFANPAYEMRLLHSVVDALLHTSGVRRIESQLMLLLTPPGPAALPFASKLLRHDRYFMETDQFAIQSLPVAIPAFRVRFVPWSERYMEDMAHVLAASYRGHVDSEINDQYRNIPGARQFLTNIVRFPGCGRFSAEASVLALDVSTGRVCGVCLASQVSEDSGHITQVCVLPALRRVQLGYELIRQSAVRMVNCGNTTVSLTVTCANAEAVRLYQSLGFTVRSVFPALVWETA